MTTATLERGTMTMTTDDIELADLSAAERLALRADAELLAAAAEVATASAAVDVARRVAAEESTPATRSALVRSQRHLAKLSEIEILAAERYRKAAAAAGLAAEDQGESEVATLQKRIRASVTVAASIVGIYGSLGGAASRTSSSQISAAHLAALGEYDRAVRALRFQQDAAGWPKANRGGNRDV